ncbi:MAG TPA: peptide chain release factor N(5)-glutamine methyltransferase [Edaphobacter sp.]|nr:peptide chain release factor N(5)-glutamine methyltransferase [Edaphobacter sp.]
MTVQQALQSAAQQLATDPLLRDFARRDAETLMLHLLTLSRASLLAHPGRELTADQLHCYQTFIQRRVRHEPLQYITGTQEFYGLSFRVSPAVLIPRPETEHLVEAVLERLPHDQPLDIVDIGTGSGAIAIALATHLPHAHLTALDLSPAALEVAQSNAAVLNVADRIRFELSDLLSALTSQSESRLFDAIVSNPPYVSSRDAHELHPQVREHEPATALFAGDDGLAIYRRLIPQAHAMLREGGLLALEIGHGQSEAIRDLLAGWKNIDLLEDLQSIPRVAIAYR